MPVAAFDPARVIVHKPTPFSPPGGNAVSFFPR